MSPESPQQLAPRVGNIEIMHNILPIMSRVSNIILTIHLIYKEIHNLHRLYIYYPFYKYTHSRIHIGE